MAQKRHMLVLAHTGRHDALSAAVTVCDQLVGAGLTPVVAPEQAEAFRSCSPVNWLCWVQTLILLRLS